MNRKFFLLLFLISGVAFSAPPTDQVERFARLVEDRQYIAAHKLIAGWDTSDQREVLSEFFVPLDSISSPKLERIHSKFWAISREHPSLGAKWLAVLLDGADSDLKRSTTIAMQATKSWSQHIEPVLEAAIASEPHQFEALIRIERDRLIEFIAKNGDGSLLPTFRRAQISQDQSLRQVAYFFMGRNSNITNLQVVDDVISAMGPEQPLEVRRDAARFVSEHTNSFPHPVDVLDGLIGPAVKSGDSVLQQSVIAAFAQIPRREGPPSGAYDKMRKEFDALVSYVAADEFPQDQAAKAALFLRRWGGEAHISVMAKAARSSIPDIRDAAWKRLRSQRRLDSVLGSDGTDVNRAEKLDALDRAIVKKGISDTILFEYAAGTLRKDIIEDLAEGHVLMAIKGFQELSEEAQSKFLRQIFRDVSEEGVTNSPSNHARFWTLGRNNHLVAIQFLAVLLNPEKSFRQKTLSALKSQPDWPDRLDRILALAMLNFPDPGDREKLVVVMNVAAESDRPGFFNTFSIASKLPDATARARALYYFSGKTVIDDPRTLDIIKANLNSGSPAVCADAAKFVGSHAAEFESPYAWLEALVQINPTDSEAFASVITALEAFPREVAPSSEEIQTSFRNHLATLLTRMSTGNRQQQETGVVLLNRWARDLSLNALNDLARMAPPPMGDTAWNMVNNNPRAKKILAEDGVPQERPDQIAYLDRRLFEMQRDQRTHDEEVRFPEETAKSEVTHERIRRIIKGCEGNTSELDTGAVPGKDSVED